MLTQYQPSDDYAEHQLAFLEHELHPDVFNLICAGEVYCEVFGWDEGVEAVKKVVGVK